MKRQRKEKWRKEFISFEILRVRQPDALFFAVHIQYSAAFLEIMMPHMIAAIVHHLQIQVEMANKLIYVQMFS